jgi:tRNA pseudouridine38-40 synthase
VGYPEQVFPEAAWYDCQPRFLLESRDPPRDPLKGPVPPIDPSVEVPFLGDPIA